MSDAISFVELDGQHMELLPARMVLSLLGTVDLDVGGAPGTPGTPGTGTPGPGLWLPIDAPSSSANSGSTGSSASG